MFGYSSNVHTSVQELQVKHEYVEVMYNFTRYLPAPYKSMCRLYLLKDSGVEEGFCGTKVSGLVGS